MKVIINDQNYLEDTEGNNNLIWIEHFFWFFTNDRLINEKNHMSVNFRTNGWFLDNRYIGKQTYSLILVQTNQRFFFYSALITLADMVIFLLLGFALLNKWITGIVIKLK